MTIVLAARRARGHIKGMTIRTTPDDILPTYQREALACQAARNKSMFEKSSLDRMLGIAPRNQSPRRLLDLGCGPGAPIATYLSERGLDITGVDGAQSMVDLFARTLPNAEVIHANMRTLDLGRNFDAILAWNSFFHLSHDAQRAMFSVFAAHSAPNAALMFTSGTSQGEAWGHAVTEEVYHASLDPEEYRALLGANGFKTLSFYPDDPTCQGHSVWLARFTGRPVTDG
jgi:2-polyprenyl-3-methyl-5-hydroxy-6-metoxy-1,4-benzoquinol methylase